MNVSSTWHALETSLPVKTSKQEVQLVALQARRKELCVIRLALSHPGMPSTTLRLCLGPRQHEGPTQMVLSQLQFLCECCSVWGHLIFITVRHHPKHIPCTKEKSSFSPEFGNPKSKQHGRVGTKIPVGDGGTHGS